MTATPISPGYSEAILDIVSAKSRVYATDFSLLFADLQDNNAEKILQHTKKAPKADTKHISGIFTEIPFPYFTIMPSQNDQNIMELRVQ